MQSINGSVAGEQGQTKGSTMRIVLQAQRASPEWCRGVLEEKPTHSVEWMAKESLGKI